jgi:hypothetical protein
MKTAQSAKKNPRKPNQNNKKGLKFWGCEGASSFIIFLPHRVLCAGEVMV